MREVFGFLKSVVFVLGKFCNLIFCISIFDFFFIVCESYVFFLNIDMEYFIVRVYNNKKGLCEFIKYDF